MRYIPMHTDSHTHPHKVIISRIRCLRNVEERLQFLDQHPLIIGDICSVELLQSVDTGSTDERVQCIGLLEMSAVSWLMATHLDFHGY